MCYAQNTKLTNWIKGMKQKQCFLGREPINMMLIKAGGYHTVTL